MILLIDDEKHYLELLQRILNRNNLRKYKAFSDFHAFIREIETNKNISIVVIDHDLKAQTSGLELMASVFENSLYCKVIICSGQEDLLIGLKYYENGCFYYLTKDDKDFENKFVSKIKEGKKLVKLLLQRLTVDSVLEEILKSLEDDE